MKKEIEEFLEQEKESYVHWLNQNISDFPYCCEKSSMVITAYVQTNFGVGRQAYGYYHSKKAGEEIHCWTEVDGEIIDFTFFQFLNNWKWKEFIKWVKSDEMINLDKISLYKKLIIDTQGSYLITDQNIKANYNLSFYEGNEHYQNNQDTCLIKNDLKGLPFINFLKEIRNFL